MCVTCSRHMVTRCVRAADSLRAAGSLSSPPCQPSANHRAVGGVDSAAVAAARSRARDAGRLGHVLTEHGRILENPGDIPSRFLLCVATTAAVAPPTSHRVLRLQSQLNAAFFITQSPSNTHQSNTSAHTHTDISKGTQKAPGTTDPWLLRSELTGGQLTNQLFHH